MIKTYMHQYHAPRKKCSKDRALQRRAGVFVLTIILVSAISAAAGLIQGQQLALGGQYIVNVASATQPRTLIKQLPSGMYVRYVEQKNGTYDVQTYGGTSLGTASSPDAMPTTNSINTNAATDYATSIIDDKQLLNDLPRDGSGNIDFIGVMNDKVMWQRVNEYAVSKGTNPYAMYNDYLKASSGSTGGGSISGNTIGMAYTDTGAQSSGGTDLTAYINYLNNPTGQVCTTASQGSTGCAGTDVQSATLSIDSVTPRRVYDDTENTYYTVVLTKDGKQDEVVFKCNAAARCTGTDSDGTTHTYSKSFLLSGGASTGATTTSCVPDTAAEAKRNICTTTYVDLNGTVTGCYCSPDNVARNLLVNLVACINKNTSGAQTTEQELKNLMCMSDAIVTIEKGVIKRSDATTKTVTLPTTCTSIAAQLSNVIKGAGTATGATKAESAQCVWKGAAVCYPAGFTIQSKWPLVINIRQYTCCNHYDEACKSAAQGTAAGVGTGSTGSESGWFGTTFRTGFLKGISSSLGAIAKSLFGGSASSSSGGSSSSTTSTDVTCAISATDTSITSGESTTLQWRTENAQSVKVSIADSAVAPNGDATIAPTKTTTFTVQARGRASSDVCARSVTVTVDGASADAGLDQPKLSCPSLIEPGESADITFSCTTNATSSAGTNLDTNGAVSGTVSVSPANSTEYTVSCLDEDDKIIGTNSCAIGVGEALFDIIAHPEAATRGERVRIAWLSLFMKSCKVTGPRGFSYTTDKGVVITEPFSLDETLLPNKNIQAAIYTIACESIFGKTMTKDVSVDFTE